MGKVEHWDCECEEMTKGECISLCDGCIILKPETGDDYLKPGVDIWFNNHQTGVLVTPKTAKEIGQALICMAEEMEKTDG